MLYGKPRCSNRQRATLEPRARSDYSVPMDDTPHHRQPANRNPLAPSEAELLAALAKSEAEAEAGLTVPAEAVHQRVRDTIARIKANRRTRQTTDLG